jgi:tight adherence protein B
MMALFGLVALTSVLTYAAIMSWLERRDRAEALRRLATHRAEKQERRHTTKSVLIEEGDPTRGRLAKRVLEKLRLKPAAERLLQAAGLKWSATRLLHSSIALFLAGFMVATVVTGNSMPLAAAALGVVLGSIPLAYVRRKARVRIAHFEEQFPDCLEFIARSMRAGHAFSVAIEMAQHEFADPVATEFRRIFEEQNLGQPLEIVLKKLSYRVPSMDVQFFVSAVLLQKRTGGNLAELLDKLANLIRERFKMRARIRAVSAQGLMSGRILAAIPMAVGVMMFFINRQYTLFFVNDPAGHELIAAALGLQVIGYLIIRKIVRIEC